MVKENDQTNLNGKRQQYDNSFEKRNNIARNTYHCEKCKRPKKCDAIYAYVYNSTNENGSSQIIEPCLENNNCKLTKERGTKIISFNNLGPYHGIKFIKTNTLVVPVDGVYEANYSVTAISNTSPYLSFKLVKKSICDRIPVTIPGSVYFTPIHINNSETVNGHVKFRANAGDKIKLVNNIDAIVALNPLNSIVCFCDSPNNAFLDIELIKKSNH